MLDDEKETTKPSICTVAGAAQYFAKKMTDTTQWSHEIVQDSCFTLRPGEQIADPYRGSCQYPCRNPDQTLHASRTVHCTKLR